MATRKHSSTCKAEPLNPNDRMSEHLKELTAIHAHTDALALAIAGEGADTFTDGALSAVVFDLEERIRHVRDGLAGLPSFPNSATEGENKIPPVGKDVQHG